MSDDDKHATLVVCSHTDLATMGDDLMALLQGRRPTTQQNFDMCKACLGHLLPITKRILEERRKATLPNRMDTLIARELQYPRFTEE